MTQYKKRLQWVDGKPFLFYKGQWSRVDLNAWRRPVYFVYFARFKHGRCIGEGEASCNDMLEFRQKWQRADEYISIIATCPYGETPPWKHVWNV